MKLIKKVTVGALVGGAIIAFAFATLAWAIPGGWSIPEAAVIGWWVGFGVGAFAGTYPG